MCEKSVILAPVSDVINKVLFEHETPALDDVQQRQLERLGVHTEPHLKQLCILDLHSVLVDLLVSVDLREVKGNKRKKRLKKNNTTKHPYSGFNG